MLKAKAETDDFCFFLKAGLWIWFFSHVPSCQMTTVCREKIPAEFLPFPLTAWLGLNMALKLHALMDRGGGNKKSCGGETLSDLKTLIRNKSE